MQTIKTHHVGRHLGRNLNFPAKPNASQSFSSHMPLPFFSKYYLPTVKKMKLKATFSDNAEYFGQTQLE